MSIHSVQSPFLSSSIVPRPSASSPGGADPEHPLATVDAVSTTPSSRRLLAGTALALMWAAPALAGGSPAPPIAASSLCRPLPGHERIAMGGIRHWKGLTDPQSNALTGAATPTSCDGPTARQTRERFANLLQSVNGEAEALYKTTVNLGGKGTYLDLWLRKGTGTFTQDGATIHVDLATVNDSLHSQALDSKVTWEHEGKIVTSEHKGSTWIVTEGSPPCADRAQGSCRLDTLEENGSRVVWRHQVQDGQTETTERREIYLQDVGNPETGNKAGDFYMQSTVNKKGRHVSANDQQKSMYLSSGAILGQVVETAGSEVATPTGGFTYPTSREQEIYLIPQVHGAPPLETLTLLENRSSTVIEASGNEHRTVEKRTLTVGPYGGVQVHTETIDAVPHRKDVTTRSDQTEAPRPQ